MRFIIILFLVVSLLSVTVLGDCNEGQITDTVNNQCYDFPFQCGSLYYLDQPEQPKCLAQCPEGYVAVKNSQNLNYCELDQCNFPDIFSFFDKTYCYKKITDIQCSYGFLIKDKDNNSVCLRVCPNSSAGFTQSSNQCTITAPDTFTWASKLEFLHCKAIRDFQNLTCIQDKSQCDSYYNDELKTCSKICAKGYTVKQDASTNQNICVKITVTPYNVSQCTGNNFIQIIKEWNSGFYIYTFDCIPNSKLDKIRFIATDSANISVELPYCPTGFTEGVDVAKGFKICTSPNNFLWSGNPILSCASKIISYTELKCLSDQSECTEFFDLENGICLKECPADKSSVTDKNGKKFCGKSFQINFKRCPFPNIPYIGLYPKCLTKDQKNLCDQVLVQDSIGNYMCLPHCPNGFTDTSTTSQKSCQTNSEFTWHNSQPLLDRSYWKNYVQLSANKNYEPCTTDFNVIELRSCFKSCPPNFTVGTSPNVSFKYCVGPNNYERLRNDFGHMSIFNSLKFSSYVFQDEGLINDPSKCTTYIIKDEQGFMLCWPNCPTGYVSGTDSATGQKTCTPPTGTLLKSQSIWNCDPTKAKDGATLGCKDSLADCKTNIDYANYACLPKCLDQSEPCYDESLDVNVCKYFQTCSSPYKAYDYMTRKCIFAKQECGDQFLLNDDSGKINWCIPECPATNTQGYDITNSVKSCKFPTGFKFSSSELSKCYGPKIREFSTGKCLALPTDCKSYYVRSLNACLTACPKGFFASTDTQTGVKICKNQIVVSCPYPKILDTKTNKCYDDEKNMEVEILSSGMLVSSLILLFFQVILY